MGEVHWNDSDGEEWSNVNNERPRDGHLDILATEYRIAGLWGVPSSELEVGCRGEVLCNLCYVLNGHKYSYHISTTDNEKRHTASERCTDSPW